MTIQDRFLTTLKCVLALLMVGLFAPTTASADTAVDQSNVLALSNQNRRGNNNNKNYQAVNSWTPYFTWIGNVQDQTKKTYTQSSMGIGFLYQSKVAGNLTMTPVVATQNDAGVDLGSRGVGSWSYNRTPVYEWMYGYKAFSWLSILFSIQNQNSINVQTKYVSGVAATTIGYAAATTDKVYYQYRGQLGLNSFMLKVNFELPWVLVWKNWMYAAYLGAGVGPGWQSWTDNRVYVQYYPVATERNTFVNTLAQKYSANCVFQIDAGFRMKPAVLSSNISILWGCKFNEWGQMLHIGELSEQGAWNQGLYKPYKARVLYSFVPYLGFQWNF